MKTNVKFLRSNEIEDIFSFEENGAIDYVKFPRSMEMTKEEVEAHIN